MADADFIRAAVARTTMEWFSPLIRETLLSEESFQAQYDLTTDAVLQFGETGVSFQRLTLLDAVADALGKPPTSIAVDDTTGERWTIECLAAESPPKVALVRGSQRLLNTHLALLSPDRDIRLKVFRAEAEAVNLSSEKWERLLAERTPDYDELTRIQTDLNTTPSAVQLNVRKSLERRSAVVADLVPNSPAYFERLVGKYDDGQTLEGFASKVAKPHMERLVAWRPFEGYLLSLLLCSQPFLSKALGELAVPSDVRGEAYAWLATNGDVLSQAAAIQLGLEQTIPSDAPELGQLVRSFMQGVADGVSFQQFSTLAILVCGEMTTTRLFPLHPPFWRRLAALAQAGLILRAAREAGNDDPAFFAWADGARRERFLVQCLVDLRVEPRWFAELILSEQLMNEFGGLVWLAAQTHSENVATIGCTADLLGTDPAALAQRLDAARVLMPGPLEGGIAAGRKLSAQQSDEIAEGLAAPTPTVESFMAFANASIAFEVTQAMADAAADALIRADYRLEGTSTEKPLMPLLLSLASGAAFTRSVKLGDAVVMLLRKYHRLWPAEIELHDTYRIAMTACASREELPSWCKAVGDFFTDMAFGELATSDADVLHMHLVEMCHVVPELWAACGAAEAALQAYRYTNNP